MLQPYSPYVLGKPHPNPPKANDTNNVKSNKGKNSKNSKGYTAGSGATHSAAAFGDVKLLKGLIEEGKDEGVHIARDVNDWQPIHEGPRPGP
jgi:hypothetical protein